MNPTTLPGDFLKYEESLRENYKLGRRSCPEDVFGNLPNEKESGLKALEELTKAMLSTTDFATNDEHPDYRITSFKNRLSFFARWAAEKIFNGTYGDKVNYRIKLKIVLSDIEGEKFFYLSGSKKNIYFKHISSVNFNDDGIYCDTLEIKRNGVILKTGTVRYLGTHAAQEFFILSDSQDRRSHLSCEEFQVGDVIEIETWNYETVDDFAGKVLIMNKMEDAFLKVFQKPGDSITGEEASKIGKEAAESSSEFWKQNETIILR